MTVDIDKLEALRAKATQGPFEYVTHPDYASGYIAYHIERDGKRLRCEFPSTQADDEYTVEALNALPELLAEMRRLRRIEEAAAWFLAQPPYSWEEFAEALRRLIHAQYDGAEKDGKS